MKSNVTLTILSALLTLSIATLASAKEKETVKRKNQRIEISNEEGAQFQVIERDGKFTAIAIEKEQLPQEKLNEKVADAPTQE